jgi:hypothetical protein
VPAGALTCAVALFNRFPLTYFDSGRYLTNAYAFAHGVQPPPNRGAFPNPFFYRPISYSLLLTSFATPITLWALPLVQGILVAFTVDLALRCAGVALSTRAFLLMFAGLVAGTSLPWFTGQVMPDLFTSLVILLVFTALWGGDRLERWERLAAAAILALGLASHLSHLPLYVALVAVGLLLRRLSRREPLSLGSLAAPLAAAVAVLVTSNWVVARKPVLSESADLFYLARLVGDGTAQRYLERACPAREYLLCADRKQLHQDSDWFLWDPAGPWRKYQENSAFLDEARPIVRGTLRQEWRRQAVASLRSALRQAGKFGTEPGWQRSEAEVAPALTVFGPSIVSAYWASRQGQRALPLEEAGELQKACVWLALVVLLACLPALWAGKNRPLLALVGVVFAGLALNALVLGSLSSVNARYQSRVIWLVPLLAWAAVAAILEARRGGEPSRCRPRA